MKTFTDNTLVSSTDSFPAQKIPSAKRDKTFFKRCIDIAERLGLNSSHNLRLDPEEMQANYDILNGVSNHEDMQKIFDPLELSKDGYDSLSTIHNFSILRPKVDLLLGEELKRRFEYFVRAIDEESINRMQDSFLQELHKIAFDYISNGAASEEELQAKLEDLAKYAKYDYKDFYEEVSTIILEIIWEKENLQSIFNSGMFDLAAVGEEHYRIDNVAGDVKVCKVDPRNLFPVRTGNSNKLEDSDIIVEVEYMSVGMIIDSFGEYLSKEDIRRIEDGFSNSSQTQMGFNPSLDATLFADQELIDTSVIGRNYDLSPVDEFGNIRVVRVRWRGMRKIGRVTGVDPETGEAYDRLVPERYQSNPDTGEKVKWFWINEALQGTRINDIYINCGPREEQTRKSLNPSKTTLGYVGVFNTYNGDKAHCLTQAGKPYQYLFNVIMKRLELIIARHHGPIVELDLSKKPSNWDSSAWLYWANITGYLVIDSFNEGVKGAATGKLAGGFNTTGRAINPELGNYIQQQVLLLQFIEEQLSNVTGITKQRQGQMESRETLGGIERAISSSSHITEPIFNLHDDLKLRVMDEVLNTAKYAWKKHKKKLQFMLGDYGRAFLDVDGGSFYNTAHSIFVTNSRENMEIRQTLKELTHAMVQNGAPISFILDVMRSKSIGATSRKIEQKEAEMKAQQQQAEQQQQQIQQQMQEQKIEAEGAMQALKDAAEQRKMDHETNLKEMDLEFKREELDIHKELKLYEIDTKAELSDEDLEEFKLELERIKLENTLEMENKELNEKIRSNKAKERIEEKKIRSGVNRVTS